MDNEIKYGIQKVTVGKDNIASTYVKFGDGQTRIADVHWDDKQSGIMICRSDLIDNTPFSEHEDSEEMNHLPDEDKVYIVFDNTRSIDVMISKLEDAKAHLQGDE